MTPRAAGPVDLAAAAQVVEAENAIAVRIERPGRARRIPTTSRCAGDRRDMRTGCAEIPPSAQTTGALAGPTRRQPRRTPVSRPP